MIHAPLLAWQTALSHLDKACRASPGPVALKTNLLVVTKNQPTDHIIPLLQAGQRWFGENKVQEAALKWPNLRAEFPNIRLHLIGALQTNKVAQALHLFDVIETIDRPKLVHALAAARAAEKSLLTKSMTYLIQVNTGKEPQKGGVLPEDLPALLALCSSVKVPISGLMCIPPAHSPAESHFRLLASLAYTHTLPYLSMGMSADFPAAISCGSSWIRLGSAIFGPRSNDQ